MEVAEQTRDAEEPVKPVSRLEKLVEEDENSMETERGSSSSPPVAEGEGEVDERKGSSTVTDLEVEVFQQ